MDESAVNRSGENSCNLWAVVVRCGSRAAERGFKPSKKEKLRKRSGQRSTQDGRWPQMPSKRPVTTLLYLILAKRQKFIEHIPAPVPHSGLPGPGKLYRLPLSSRLTLCGEEMHFALLCVGATGREATI